MKKIISKLMGGVLLLSLSMSLTSCEDILGEWSRPTPNPVTPGGGGSEGGGSTTIAVTGVKLDETNLRYLKTELTAQTLTATVSPADATDKSVTWTSSDENVATVDASGKVTPKAKGIATITATTTDGGKKATCTVNIYDGVWNINAQAAPTVPADEFWLISGNGTAEAKSITIGDGATVTLNGINITKEIECLGDATIILADGSTNTVKGSFAKAGIVVGPSGTTLTIDAETAGDGKLNATGSTNSAGIGTSYNNNSFDITCGAITIKGGEITAKGGSYSAGIGTGFTIAKNNTCEAITIKGGTVTATGDYGAAGIGTGETYGSGSNTCGAIAINGGTVTATGGNYAAGIGTGWAYGSGSNTCGAIAITANVTKVTVTKGEDSPNIMGVGYLSNGTQNCGTITFGTAAVFNGALWSPATMVAGTYGGLTLAISTTTNADDTWTLTPAP